MWEIAIAIILVGIMFVFFFIASTWNFTLFDHNNVNKDKNSVIKVFLIWMGFWLMLPLVQLASEFAIANSAAADIITLLETFYTAYYYINYVVTAYIIIYFVYNVLLYFGVNIVPKGKK